jgi:hypothetical protein
MPGKRLQHARCGVHPRGPLRSLSVPYVNCGKMSLGPRLCIVLAQSFAYESSSKFPRRVTIALVGNHATVKKGYYFVLNMIFIFGQVRLAALGLQNSSMHISVTSVYRLRTLRIQTFYTQYWSFGLITSLQRMSVVSLLPLWISFYAPAKVFISFVSRKSQSPLKNVLELVCPVVCNV